ncbi:natriuretic peptides A-like [Pelodytes ibericus]
MEKKVSLLLGSLILFIIQYHSCGGHPIVDLDTDTDLDTFKGLLERLDEKLSQVAALESAADVLDSGHKGGVEMASPEDIEIPQPEPKLPPHSRFSLKDSFLKGLRSLQNPKMMRNSGCFGRRIDRIDSLSGMGCNGVGTTLAGVKLLDYSGASSSHILRKAQMCDKNCAHRWVVELQYLA